MDEWVDDNGWKSTRAQEGQGHIKPPWVASQDSSGVVAGLGEGLLSPNRECSRPRLALLAP